MGFQNFSMDIYLQNQHSLHCQCKKLDGSYGHSQIDLNDCLGNSNGIFPKFVPLKSSIALPRGELTG